MQLNQSLRVRLALALGVLLACSGAFAQTADQMLGRAPTQANVDVDYPTDAEKAGCKIQSFKESGYQGVGLYKSDGKTLLRAWCAPVAKSKENAKATVEQIRFYKDGQEVFRDILNKEARWLNGAGSRRGVIGSDKKTIVSWSVISPEEATQEAVDALIAKDFAKYQRVAFTADDLKTLGLSGKLAENAQKQIQGVTKEAFAQLAATLAIPEDARWGAFNSSKPATIPANDELAKDLTIYYNAAIVVMKGDDASQNQQLYIGDLVKVGEAWKILGLPTGEPFGQATGSVSTNSFFLPSIAAAGAEGVQNSDVGEVGAALSEAYQKLEAASPAEYPELCDNMVNLLIDAAKSAPQESESMLSQAVDVVFNGIQSGYYPNGAQKLQELAEKIGTDVSPELQARIRYRQITADFYAVAQAQPQPKPAELNKAQEKYSDSLAAFVEEFSTTTAGAEAAMSLALDQEFMLDSEAAIKYYQQVAQNFENASIGKKAAGAIARLQAEGGQLQLPPMNYFGGGTCDLKAATGKPTIVFCWGSWDQENIAGIKALASKANIIGVNIDTAPSPEAAQEYYQQIFKGIPWKNLCDPNGFEGEIAIALGLQTAPWMILIDGQGKVVRSNITNLEDLTSILDELK